MKDLAELVCKNFNLTPAGIIKELNLLNPIYQNTAVYGHFGRDEFEWEKTDKAFVLVKYVSKLP